MNDSSPTSSPASPSERHVNEGPAHEGSRSDAGGSYGDFSRPDKSDKFNTTDGGGSVAPPPTVVDVEQTFDPNEDDAPGAAVPPA
jgi:hypothetical protein